MLDDVVSVDWSTDDEPGSSATDLPNRDTLSPTLPLLQLADWDQTYAYDEHPPTCIHYAIEWKVTLNNRCISKDTETNLVLAPGAYWIRSLCPKLEALVARKLPPNKPCHIDDTAIIVSVNDRGEQDLIKRADDLDIEWAVIEQQLRAWGRLFRAGKRLKIALSFNYVESGQSSAAARGGSRRGATASQFAERDAQLQDEESVLGQPSVWKHVYNLLRCPGPPCHLGPHCWIDPVGKRHYKLKTHHLKALIEHAKQGYTLQTHDDVPPDVRDQLYAEDQQDASRKRKRAASSSADLPPIKITNVLPTHPTTPADSVSRSASEPVEVISQAPSYLGISGLRDVAVKQYADWHCSKVNNALWKTDFQKACRLTLEEGLDLEHVFADRDAAFFIEGGIRQGIARRWVDDVIIWDQEKRAGSQ